MYEDPIRKLQEEMYGQLIALREGLFQTVDLSCAAASNPGAVSNGGSSSVVIPTVS